MSKRLGLLRWNSSHYYSFFTSPFNSFWQTFTGNQRVHSKHIARLLTVEAKQKTTCSFISRNDPTVHSNPEKLTIENGASRKRSSNRSNLKTESWLPCVFSVDGKHLILKALANEAGTHCCRHKCFPVCPRAQHFLRTQKMFLILFRNILCPQQMFPRLRSLRNIMSNNLSATMCPRLPGP